MYCPKCSQIQTEDGLRFCSRCGFQLGVVKELLAEPGSAPAIGAGSETPTKFFSRRKQDLLFGATVMCVAATLVVQLSWVAPKAALVFPLWMIWFAFSLFVLSFDALVRVAHRLFSDDDHSRSRQRAPGINNKVNPATSELPPMQNLPVALGFDRVNTGE
ncbi:MAG TPA: hypothetical protein VE977_04120, partial [Pyrinomonadaceae bacterium]|nr:hypothetical protein [Pyrinomonadaceae bacterium]